MLVVKTWFLKVKLKPQIIQRTVRSQNKTPDYIRI